MAQSQGEVETSYNYQNMQQVYGKPVHCLFTHLPSVERTDRQTGCVKLESFSTRILGGERETDSFIIRCGFLVEVVVATGKLPLSS